MKRLSTFLLLAVMTVGSMFAADVTVTMNSTSKTMSLVNKATGEAVEVGTPSGTKYTFQADYGTYVLTAYGTNGTTVNGTIELNVTEEVADFTVLTCTAYATNKDWKADEDYTVEVDVNTREGVKQAITVGNSVTAGRKTFLALNGNSYYAQLIPNADHQAEGYMTLYKGGTLTGGVNVSGAIPTGADYTITLPADAGLYLGIKFAHFIKFQEIAPTNTVANGGEKAVTYHLANGQVYNFRTWKSGGLTQAGYFTFSTDEAKCPKLGFTADDYAAFGAKTIKHDVKWNGGYETGDIFVNINERGHLRMNVGDKYEAHAMRTWQLTDNSTNNYFMEPDFHYTVVDVNGNPSSEVIEIENPDTTTDPWSVIKAVGKGTAIVLVTYDAIGLNFYGSNAAKTAYMGGEYWSAVWPENTAAYVVTVGDEPCGIDPNMVINEAYNTGTLKNAGKYVDAEHDVFYYLDTEEGYAYTFTPSGVASVEIAYPAIGEQTVSYKGFSASGVKKNDDGSYTVLLKLGRQIVKLTDAQGHAVYQVLTAKPCHRELTNATRPGSQVFQPGDQVKVQYSGLFHPSNKLAGIYNMSGYVTYNGIPNGTSLILGSGQYTFGSAASAQAVSVTIPSDYDAAAGPIVMNEGVIQVNGYGDPIGNHRYISRLAGRSANFTAVAHKTYFGAIPDIAIPVTAYRNMTVALDITPAEAEVVVTDAAGNKIGKNAQGKYDVTYGTYNVEGQYAGYRALHTSFTLGDDAENETVVPVTFVEAEGDTWDGSTKSEPEMAGEVYQITNGAELAWLASEVNSGKGSIKAELMADIDLGDFAWTPIGTNSKQYKASFAGSNHVISGLYINAAATYQGLFGYVNGAELSDFTVEGEVRTTANYASGVVAYSAASTLSGLTNRATVHGKQYVGGITAYANGATTIDRCVNEGNITGSSSYAAGITPYMQAATTVVTNCMNSGDIDGTANVASITANIVNASGTVKNCLNIGRVLAEVGSTGNVYAGTADPSTRVNAGNNYVLCNYANGAILETVVTTDQLASGEVAYKLGEAWGQQIGTDARPVLGGSKVLFDEATGSYYNEAELAVATLENEDLDYLALGADSHIPELTEDFDEEFGFQSGDFWFDMNTYSDWATWWGYGVANHTATTFENLDDQFNSVAGGGHDGSENYGVAYVGDFMGPVYITLTTDEMARVPGLYVTNAAYAFTSMANGDGFARKFSRGDWFRLTATGYGDDGEVTGTKDYYLADLRSADKSDWYILNDWQYMDLSSLGKVRAIQFTLSSSDEGDYGMNTPAYFCFDDLGAKGVEQAPQGNWNVLFPDVAVTIGQGGYSTFAAAYATEIPEGVEAYYATVEGSTVCLHQLEGSTIAAGEGVILKGEEGARFTMTASASSASRITGNALVGVTDASTFTNDGHVYVISTRNDETAFYKYTAATFPAGKAYLAAPAASNARMTVLFDGDATAIAGVGTGDKPSVYNLQGQRVLKTLKGVNIVNGRKVQY